MVSGTLSESELSTRIRGPLPAIVEALPHVQSKGRRLTMIKASGDRTPKWQIEQQVVFSGFMHLEILEIK